MNESAGEKRLIKALNNGGFLGAAEHRCYPGFSDILAIRGNNVFLLEIKDMGRKYKTLREDDK